MTPFSKGIVEAVLFVIVIIASWLMALLEQRTLRDYGFGLRRAFAKFVSGTAWGFAFISLLIVVLFASNHLAFEHPPSNLGSVVLYGLEWFISMFFTAAFEEALFRGYLQWALGRGITFWGASLLLAIIFGVAHGSNAGESHVGLVSASLLGLAFSVSIWYTRSLWWAVGFHTAWNWGMTFFYGTPNSGLLAKGHLLAISPRGSAVLSGGPTGPEGSILLLPIVILLFLVIYLTCRSKGPLEGANAAGRT